MCLDGHKNKIDIINYSHKESAGIVHAGDNRTGAGSGDDELIRIDFMNLPNICLEVFIVVNMYTDNCTF